MEFTFGITTGGLQEDNLNKIIDSIEVLNIPKYEVIIVGNADIQRQNTTVIPFDENQRNMWITRKKNIITLSAQYENIVYLHDYVIFDADWYKGYLEFGNDFDVCVNKMLNTDNSRYRDWILLCTNIKGTQIPIVERLLPYEENRFHQIHVPGTYWVAKKNFMLQHKLNEGLCWGDGEDVEFSHRICNITKIKINLLSYNKLLKWHDTYLTELPIEIYKKIL